MGKKDNKQLTVGIVTGTYNSEKYISDCIGSVNEQDYPNISHIIIDGASKDDTLNIIKKMPNRVTRIISEPDKGIYDAMNKGLKNSEGDILGILNSDDFYNSKQAISKVVNAFNTSEADCVFGDLYYVNAENPEKVVRKWVTGRYSKNAFRRGWHPAHPSFFVRREVYEKYGYFDEELSLAADFEIMLRFIERHGLKTHYIAEPLVRMRLGGATSKNVNNIIEGNKQCIKAFKKNNMRVPFLYPLIRLIPKLKQFVR